MLVDISLLQLIACYLIIRNVCSERYGRILIYGIPSIHVPVFMEDFVVDTE